MVGSIGRRPNQVDALSLSSAMALPNQRIASSIDVGWTSLLLEHHRACGASDPFEVRATPDQTLVLATRGQHELDIFRAGRWRTTVLRPGAVSTTAPEESCRLRWRSARPGQAFETVHLYLPQATFLELQDDLRRVGQRPRTDRLSTLSLRDDVAVATVAALREAMAEGVPDLFAETACQWLAVRLLCGGRAIDPTVANAAPARVGDRRLARAVEALEADIAVTPTLDRLASEAGVGKYHFLRLFQARMGCTPWQYLTGLRMERARDLLVLTDLPIAEVAVRSGYERATSFATAFLRHTGATPTRYRAAARSSGPASHASSSPDCATRSRNRHSRPRGVT